MTAKLCALSLAVIVIALPGMSQAERARTVSGEYNTLIIDPDEGSPSAEGQFSNGVAFTPRKGERSVSVVVEDTSGLPTRAVVGQDLDGDGTQDVVQEICGASEAPLRFRKGIDVVVQAQEGPCEDGTNAMATFGTITVTFYRR
ncbi:MAG: hypothetical protein ACRDLB_13750 [Actinomycetota bacterium]